MNIRGGGWRWYLRAKHSVRIRAHVQPLRATGKFKVASVVCTLYYTGVQQVSDYSSSLQSIPNWGRALMLSGGIGRCGDEEEEVEGEGEGEEWQK